MSTRPVVVAVDGSEESQRAVEWAVCEAELHSAPLRIVSAASLPKMVVLQLQPERDAVLGYVREQRDRALAAAAARAAQLAPGLPIDTDPVEGQAARAVTDSGSGALMLVTGFRGIGAFAAVRRPDHRAAALPHPPLARGDLHRPGGRARPARLVRARLPGPAADLRRHARLRHVRLRHRRLAVGGDRGPRRTTPARCSRPGAAGVAGALLLLMALLTAKSLALGTLGARRPAERP